VSSDVNDRLIVGSSAALTRIVTADDIATFGRITGDTNPVHEDDEFARAYGFRGRIAQGMLVASHIAGVLGTLLPGRGSIYLKQTLSFKAPVYVGDQITATATVLQIRADKPIITLSTTCTNQDGTVVIDGEAVILHRATA
jgi:3-hydroxybutyryl-CoA dehydratase